MGADMLSVVLLSGKDAPVADPDVPVRVLAESAARAWMAAAAQAKDTSVAFDELDMRSPVDCVAPYASFDEAEAAEGPMVVARFEPAVISVVEDAISAFRDRVREWNHYWLPDGVVLSVSGGMSWGDSPTEACDAFFTLSMCDVEGAILGALGFINLDRIALASSRA